MKISIGCRNKQVGKGQIAVDIIKPIWADKYPERFLLCDGIKLPFKDGECNEILASHVFEHFKWYADERIIVLKEWWRVLAIGGIIKIIVPNMDRYCRLYVENKWNMERFSQMTFGSQFSSGEFHYCCYNADSLTDLVRTTYSKECSIESVTFGKRGRFPISDLEIRLIIRKIAGVK